MNDINNTNSSGITIKKIAELAGVHRSTVDKVLHNREGVSDSVRKKIKKIIEENNYQVNPIGKALKSQDKEIKIGIILLKVDARVYLKKGILAALAGYKAFKIKIDFAEVDFIDINQEIEVLRKYRDDQYAGIILCPINAPEIVEEINACEESGIPVVTINTDIKGSNRTGFIGQDGYKAGRVAGRFMGEFLGGCGNVVILTSDGDERQSFPFGTREGGFRETLRSTYPNITVIDCISTKEEPQRMIDVTNEILDLDVEINGIYITCGGVKEAGDVIAARNRQEIRLICFEDYPEILELMRRGVVTLTLGSRLEDQGRKGMQVLLDRLIYERLQLRKHIYTDICVIVKESMD